MKRTVIFFLFFIFIACRHEADIADNKTDPGDITIPENCIIVSQSGNGDFTSIQAACNSVTPGYTILIRKGTYKEAVNLTKSGEPDNYITIKNYPAENVVIDAGQVFPYCLYAKNINYVKIEGITLTGAKAVIDPSDPDTGADWGALFIEGPASHIIVDGVTASNNRTCGLAFNVNYDEDALISDVTIQNCLIKNNRYHGINIYRRCYNFTISDNHITESGWNTGIDKNLCFGIICVVWDENDRATGPKNIAVINNEIDYSREQGIQTWNVDRVLIKGNYFHHNGSSGIQVEDGTTNFAVEDNVCENNALLHVTETGIWIDDAQNGIVKNNISRYNEIGLLVTKSEHCIIRNNVIYENNVTDNDFSDEKRTPSGLLVEQYDGIENRNIVILHNTIYKNGSTETGYPNVGFGVWDSSIKDVFFINNIVGNALSPIELFISAQSFVSDYNTIYNNAEFEISYNTQLYNFSNYQENSGKDINSISRNPDFIDPQNHDFRLNGNSPCKDAGGFLTKTAQSGSGTEVAVTHALFFTDGFGVTDGDSIVVGDNAPVTIKEINYETNIITVDRSIAWNNADTVTFHYNDLKPDMGAFEY